MESEQSGSLKQILEHMEIGIATLSCHDLRIQYANPYLIGLLNEPWRSQGIIDHLIDEVASAETELAGLPGLLRHVCATGRRVERFGIPYEGMLATRGRTYWHLTAERLSNVTSAPAASLLPEGSAQQHKPDDTEATHRNDSLLVTLEDMTTQEHSRLRLNAIHSISSAIAGPFALPQVLDRILQSVQELVGSTRCAITLREPSLSESELPTEISEGPPRGPETDQRTTDASASQLSRMTIAAQKGIHPQSQNWYPQVNEQVLLGLVARYRRTLIIADTSTIPAVELPLLDDHGVPRRPGSVLCVPIFEPTSSSSLKNSNASSHFPVPAVLGTIEVYHRRTRGFPNEEVKLLEQFAQQAGLAIQNTRLFRSINHYAQAANRNARQQKNVLQAIPDGVIIYDHRWRVIDANPAIRQLLGWTDEVIGLPVKEALARSRAVFLHNSPSVADLTTAFDRRALSKHVEEFKMIGADGRSYTMLRSQAPILDEMGDIFASVVIYHDVTEQVAARERIEAEVDARTAQLAQRNAALQLAQATQALESQRLQLLLERLPSGVMLISADDNHITVINHQAVQKMQQLGIPLEPLDDLDEATRRVIGRNIEELFAPLTVYGSAGVPVPYEERPLALALQRGEASEAELHIAQPDGQNLFLLSNAAPLRDSGGTITGAVFVWHDTTRLKTLERAREDFFTTMAHELKTPLANIRVHLSALQADDFQWSATKQREFLETADEQVSRLVGMINHFLDASRVEAGALRLELEPILLPEMLEDLQERLEALIVSSQRSLTISLPPNLPAVLADYELIIRVLTNLLSNAFRYAPEGDTVRLEAEVLPSLGDQCPSWIELRVIDRGPGMTAEQQATLFTRFSTFADMKRPAANRPGQPAQVQRRSNARWSSATGLGLYISRGIIKAHNSILTVKSSPEEGATFAFTLPIATSVRREETP